MEIIDFFYQLLFSLYSLRTNTYGVEITTRLTIAILLVYAHKLYLLTARSIRKGLDWLHGFTGLCNNKIGSPYDRCTRALERAVEDCKVVQHTPLCVFIFIISIPYNP